MAEPDYNNVTAVTPNVSGAVFVAPAGTPLPADADSALNSAFVCVGAITEDAPKRTHKMDTKMHHVWGGDVALVTKKNYEENMSFSIAECNAESAKLGWGEDAVTEGENGAFSFVRDGFSNDGYSIVIESVLKGGRHRRDVTAEAYVTSVGDEELKDDEIFATPLEFGCIRNAALGGCSKTYVGEFVD